MWPANIHSIGKDILRFHAVYWPAMLMAAGIEPPMQVWAHGYLTVGGKKMSKTNLTGIHPFQLTDHFGTDSYRYYWLAADRVGRRRGLLVGVDGRAPQRRPRERAREPREPCARDARLELRRRRARAATLEGVEGRPARGDRGRRRPVRRARARGRALAGGGRRLGRRRRREQVPRGARALEGREGPRAGRRTRVDPVRVGRDLAGPRRPDPADRCRAPPSGCGTSSASGGQVVEQRVPAAVAWGQLAPGTRTTKGEALFPRLEADEG